MELHYGRVTSKGKITIPSEIRKRLELETGASVLFMVKADGTVQFSSPLQDLRRHFGTLPMPPGMTGVDLADLGDEIGAAEAVKYDRRSRGIETEVDEPAAALVTR